MRFSKVRSGSDRLAMRLGSVLVGLQLIQRDAEIAERHRHIGLDRERAPRGLHGQTRAAGYPQHLSEIGVE